MRKVWLIVKREYVTRVKTRAFVIATIVVPLIGVGFVLLTGFLSRRQPTNTFRLAVLDESGELAPALGGSLNAKLANGQPEFTIEQTVERPASVNAAQEELRDGRAGGAAHAQSR